jgi:hypothetical protein
MSPELYCLNRRIARRHELEREIAERAFGPAAPQQPCPQQAVVVPFPPNAGFIPPSGGASSQVAAEKREAI